MCSISVFSSQGDVRLSVTVSHPPGTERSSQWGSEPCEMPAAVVEAAFQVGTLPGPEPVPG